MSFVYFFLGILAMQIFYLTFNYIFFQRRYLLYYLLFLCDFAFLMLLFFISPVTVYIKQHFHSYIALVFGVMFISQGLYYIFLRHFIGSPLKYPFFNKIITVAERVFIITGFLLIANTFLSKVNPIIEYTSTFIYAVNYLIQIYAIVFLIRSKQRINYLIAAGAVLLSVMVKLAVFPILVNNDGIATIESRHSYIITGLILEFVFFNFTIIYKAKLSEVELLNFKIQKEQELYKLRTEIGNDLHDDVGATLSSLHVYAEMSKKILDTDPSKTKEYIKKISSGLVYVMTSINDVIWAINGDAIESRLLSSRIKDLYFDVFDAKDIQCIYNFDENLEKKISRIDVRKYLLLIAKESINNVVKHSGADKIEVSLIYSLDNILLSVADNGVGIPDGLPSSGNGLLSLKRRAAQMGGYLSIGKASLGGVLIECYVPITNIS